MTKPAKWVRRALWIAGSILVGTGALAAGLVLWINSSSGHAFVAGRIESMVNEKIKGSLRIGGVDRVSVDRLVAHDLRFSAPGGETVLFVRSAELDVQVLDLFRGHIAAASGRVRGGTLTVATDAHGELGLDQTFRSRPHEGSSEGGATIDLSNIEASGMTLRARVSEVPDATVTRMTFRARIWTPAAGAKVQLSASRITGHLAIATPMPIRMQVARGTLHYDGASAERARVDVRGTMGGSPVRLVTAVANHGSRPRISAMLTVKGTIGWLRSFPLIMQGTLADLVSSSFELRVRTTH